MTRRSLLKTGSIFGAGMTLAVVESLLASTQAFGAPEIKGIGMLGSCTNGDCTNGAAACGAGSCSPGS